MAIPYLPQNVILQTGNGQNLLTWDIVSGATGYPVYRSTDGVTFSLLATPTTNYYTDTAATVGTNYYYQVYASNTDGTSPVATPYPASITPCLPGQINLGYLRYQAQLRSDKLNSQYLTTDEWNFNINQSANELYDILVDKYGEDYFFAPPLETTLTGAAYYAVPNGSNYSAVPALYKLNGIDASVGGIWVPMARANWSDRDKYNYLAGQSGALCSPYQMSYRQMGSNLFFFPSNSNLTVRIWYVPMLTQMLADTDMLPFSISGWSEFVIVDAAMKAMIKEESFEKWNALAAIKVALMERIEITAANRDVGQPNTISNTRSTMGDPGFAGWGNGWGSFGGMGGGF